MKEMCTIVQIKLELNKFILYINLKACDICRIEDVS